MKTGAIAVVLLPAAMTIVSLCRAEAGVPQVHDVTTMRDVVRANLEQSYVVYPIGFTGLDSLVFEANIVPNFSVLPRSWHVALFLTPKIVLRMFAVFWEQPFFGWSSVALEWHPPFTEDADLRATYGNTRLHLATTIYSSVGGFVSDVSAELTAIFGDMQKPTNASTFLARFPITVRYAIRPPGIDVGLYAAYYQGQDYYNIWYDRFISVLQIGFSGNLSTGLDFDPSRPPATSAEERR